MRVFVTGGTGLLGNTLIRQLTDRGDQVSALVRSEPAPEVFDNVPVELIHAELVPADSPEEQESSETGEAESAESESAHSNDAIDQVISQCDVVVHSAAKIHLGWTQMDSSMRVNRDGTRRIAEACLRHDKKMILIGTVDTQALGSPQTLADETTPINHAGGQVECAYVASKRAALAVVDELVPQGLKAVIIHPGFMLGPWDWKPSSGRMIVELGKTWRPLSPSGGCSLCDSRDVAAAVISAMEKEITPGRQFILAGHNWTYHKLWSELAKRVDMNPPLRSVGPGLQFLAGSVVDLCTKLLGREGDLNSAAMKMSSQFHWYDSKRAERELGYQNRPAEETLDAAADWVNKRFVLPAKHSGS